MARRIGATAARRRGRGPPRRAAVLPVPHLSRVGVAKATIPVTGRRPTRSSCCRPRWRASGLAAGADAAAGRDQARLLHRPRPALPPAAALRRPARDAQARRPRLGGGRRRSISAQATVGDVRVEPGFRGRTQRTIARLEDETGSIDATWFGRRFIERRLFVGAEIVVSGKVKHFGRRLTLDNPEFQVVAERHRAAPRRPDRAGLPR